MIVTLLGWAWTIKGTLYLLVPDLPARKFKHIVERPRHFVIAGVCLAYVLLEDVPRHYISRSCNERLSAVMEAANLPCRLVQFDSALCRHDTVSTGLDLLLEIAR